MRAGWSAPVLFTNPEDKFSRDEAKILIGIVSSPMSLGLGELKWVFL